MKINKRYWNARADVRDVTYYRWWHRFIPYRC